MSDVPLEHLIDMTRGVEGRPPALLWAADVLAVHTLVRQCATAGYLEREEALGLLERVTDRAAAMFPDEEAFLRDASVGVAVANGPSRVGATREWAALMDSYRASEWPARLGPWPTPSEGAR